MFVINHNVVINIIIPIISMNFTCFTSEKGYFQQDIIHRQIYLLISRRVMGADSLQQQRWCKHLCYSYNFYVSPLAEFYDSERFQRRKRLIVFAFPWDRAFATNWVHERGHSQYFADEDWFSKVWKQS